MSGGRGNPDGSTVLFPRSARMMPDCWWSGLAPGLRGANRSGRPFTGDGAGDFLYPALIEAGFARGSYKGTSRGRP